jgi:hypothetical protein
VTRATQHVHTWILKNDRLIRDQLALMPYWPHTMSPIEKQEFRLGSWFVGREFPTRNQWRTDLLLDLITNEMLGRASVRNYQRRIREHLDRPLIALPRHLIYASPRLH